MKDTYFEHICSFTKQAIASHSACCNTNKFFEELAMKISCENVRSQHNLLIIVSFFLVCCPVQHVNYFLIWPLTVNIVLYYYNTSDVQHMGGFTRGGELGLTPPPIIYLTPLINCSTPPKFRFTPPILCERL